MARVRDGQTIVIAGLISERKRNIDTGSPRTDGDPLLGYCFCLTEEIKEKSELVILITPKIHGESQMLDFAREDLERSRDLQEERNVWMNGKFCPTV